MRIGFNFHTSDNYISGVEYYSLGLLRSLLEIDHKNQYIVFTNRPGLVISHIGTRDNLTVRDCSFLKTRLSRIIWEHIKLPRIIKKEKLNILHCPHYICPFIKSSVPYVITIHDTIAIDHPDWCKRTNAAYYGLFMARSVKSAAKVVAVSEFSKRRIEACFSIDPLTVTVICPGIDSDVFNLCRDIEKQNSIKKRYGLPEIYIIYSGNIEPKKNILNLLKAFRILKDSGCQHSLVISGQRNWKSKEVFNLCDKFSSGDIVFTGYIDRKDIGFVYKMSDGLVSASLCEGFGFPVLEAFACGVPVAASKVGVLQELDVGSYTLLDPDNPEQMAEAVRQMLFDRKCSQIQIKTALIEVAKFNWIDCAERTLKLYKEV